MASLQHSESPGYSTWPHLPCSWQWLPTAPKSCEETDLTSLLYPTAPSLQVVLWLEFKGSPESEPGSSKSWETSIGSKPSSKDMSLISSKFSLWAVWFLMLAAENGPVKFDSWSSDSGFVLLKLDWGKDSCLCKCLFERGSLFLAWHHKDWNSGKVSGWNVYCVTVMDLSFY